MNAYRDYTTSVSIIVHLLTIVAVLAYEMAVIEIDYSLVM